VVPWLVKAALLIGLVVGVVVEVGRPAAARLELHGLARDAANAAEANLADFGRRASRQEARAMVESEGAHLVRFDVATGGRVQVRVARHVDPLVLDDLATVESWYDVEIDAESDGKTAG
jgi:hypothetical protein